MLYIIYLANYKLKYYNFNQFNFFYDIASNNKCNVDYILVKVGQA